MQELADLRRSAKVSQRDLARRVGVSRSRITRLERGESEAPDAALYARLAAALECDEVPVRNAVAGARGARRSLGEAVRARDIDRVAKIANAAAIPMPVRRQAKAVQRHLEVKVVEQMAGVLSRAADQAEQSLTASARQGERGEIVGLVRRVADVLGKAVEKPDAAAAVLNAAADQLGKGATRG